jgi:DNA polymerase III alpha subunit (gram-positive type)
MYIVFDTETTGVTDNSNLLTAHFEILDNNLQSVCELGIQLKNSSYHIYPEALIVNNIDILKHNKESSSLTDCRQQLCSFLETARANSGCRTRFIPVGHNINFDIKFIKSSGLLTDEEYSNQISCNSIDTLVVAQFMKACGLIPRNQNLKLASLVTYLERGIDPIPKSGFHDARYDVQATIKLLKIFKDLVNINGVSCPAKNPL